MFFVLFWGFFKCALIQSETNSLVPHDFSAFVPSVQMFPGMFECLEGIWFPLEKKEGKDRMNHHFAQVATVATRHRSFAIFGFELYISSYQDKVHLFISFHSVTMFKDELVGINQSLVMFITGFHFWKHVFASLDTCKITRAGINFITWHDFRVVQRVYSLHRFTSAPKIRREPLPAKVHFALATLAPRVAF